MKRPDKRRLVNWKEKNGRDDERISQRLDGRSQPTENTPIKSKTKPQITLLKFQNLVWKFLRLL